MKTSELLHKYIAFIATRRAEGTVAMRRSAYKTFLARHGDVEVADISHGMIYDLCHTDGKLRLMIHSLGAACNWAVKCGYVAKNPMAGIETPAGRSRGRDCVLTPAQHATILAVTNNSYTCDIRNLIIALENTGARPGEIAKATAENFSATDGAIVYHGMARMRRGERSHKNSRKDRERLILLTGEALELTRRLAKRHASGGALFRNRQGRAWNTGSWGRAFTKLSRRVRMPHLIAYSYRHTFATRWLLSGGSVEVLAELMGNSPEVIHRHYAHLLADKAGLRVHLEVFRTKMAASL